MSHTEVTDSGTTGFPTHRVVSGHNLLGTKPTLTRLNTTNLLTVDVVPDLPDDVIHSFYLSLIVECNIPPHPTIHKGAEGLLHNRYNRGDFLGNGRRGVVARGLGGSFAFRGRKNRI